MTHQKPTRGRCLLQRLVRRDHLQQVSIWLQPAEVQVLDGQLKCPGLADQQREHFVVRHQTAGLKRLVGRTLRRPESLLGLQRLLAEQVAEVEQVVPVKLAHPEALLPPNDSAQLRPLWAVRCSAWFGVPLSGYGVQELLYLIHVGTTPEVDDRERGLAV